MKITATALNRKTRMKHVLVDSENPFFTTDGDEHGNVSLEISTREISLTGQYTVRVLFNVEEINRLMRASNAGYLMDRIEILEEKLKELREV